MVSTEWLLGVQLKDSISMTSSSRVLRAGAGGCRPVVRDWQLSIR